MRGVHWCNKKNCDEIRGVNHSQLTRPFKTCIRTKPTSQGVEWSNFEIAMRCTFSRYKHGNEAYAAQRRGWKRCAAHCTAENVPDARRASHKRVGQEKDGAPAILETAEETPAEGAAEMAESEMAESEMAESEMAEAVRAEAAVARWWASRCPPMCLCKQGPTSSQYASTCSGGQGKCGRAESPYAIDVVDR